MFGDLKEAAPLAVGGEFPPGNMSMAEAAAHVQAQNATWLNIHQGSNLNLYIDYPLRSDLPGGDRLEEMVSACHALGMHVKLYFTTRELTNRCSELFLLKGLPNNEILFGGTGGGGAWLQEHLASDYETAWSQPSPSRHNPGSPSLNGVSILGDEAIHDSGYSRWNSECSSGRLGPAATLRSTVAATRLLRRSDVVHGAEQAQERRAVP